MPEIKTRLAGDSEDVAEVKHGYWKECFEDWRMQRMQMVGYQCSVCGFRHYGSRWNYCPSCGAKMDGEKKRIARMNIKSFEYITPEFISNCLFEAIRAKFKNWRGVKIYYCKPRIAENGKFQWMHFMWSDGVNDYDFTDKECANQLRRIFPLFYGQIRKFPLGFAKRFCDYRDKR